MKPPSLSMFTSPIPPEIAIHHYRKLDDSHLNHPPENAIHYNNFCKWLITPIAIAALPIVTLAALIAATCYCLIRGYTPQELVAKTLGLPALSLNLKDLDKARKKIPSEKQVWLKTEDGIQLNGVQIKTNSKKWVVYMNGNRGSYETNYGSICFLSKQTNANVLCVNYRGVGKSKGYCRSAKNIVLDGKAMVQHLINQGVKQSDIIVYGYSLGGGVGAQVVSMEQFNRVHFISDRSFSSLHLAVKTFFWIPIYRELIAWIVSRKWGNLDSYDAVKNLGDRIKIVVAPQDYLIGFNEASLYSAFKKDGKKPHTLSLKFQNVDNRCCFFRCRDLAKTHYWDLPEHAFPRFTKDLFTE